MACSNSYTMHSILHMPVPVHAMAEAYSNFPLLFAYIDHTTVINPHLMWALFCSSYNRLISQILPLTDPCSIHYALNVFVVLMQIVHDIFDKINRFSSVRSLEDNVPAWILLFTNSYKVTQSCPCAAAQLAHSPFAKRYRLISVISEDDAMY
jgi:hypothetical protein